MPRTAGFNAIDIGAMTPEGLFFTDFLMFIGGGTAGTAGDQGDDVRVAGGCGLGGIAG